LEPVSVTGGIEARVEVEEGWFVSGAGEVRVEGGLGGLELWSGEGGVIGWGREGG